MSHHFKILLAVFLLAIFSFFFLKLLFHKPKPILFGHTPPEYDQIIREKVSWRKILKKTDTRLFYEELKNAYQNNYNQHVVGHIFGDLVYEKDGVKGIEICDTALYWGCYHAITSSAIADKGLQAIHDLDKICKQKTSVSAICAHGIGHGLVDYFGPSHLLTALESCELIEGDESCFTGVFMQYNFPTDSEKEGLDVQVRPFIAGQEYSPCGDFPEKYDQSCYAELPRWWDRVFSSDFQKMGLYCSSIKDKKRSDSCFAGIGGMVSLLADPSLEKTLSTCQKLPNSFGQNTCLVFASLGFASDMYNQDKALPVCLTASPEYQDQCIKK